MGKVGKEGNHIHTYIQWLAIGKGREVKQIRGVLRMDIYMYILSRFTRRSK